MNNTLTDVSGIQVGHATHMRGATGCTVVLCPRGTIGGVDVRGGAPGTRETDMLKSYNHVEEVNAVILSGGSAFGLATADGVMRFLEERGAGYVSGTGYVVPIVVGAILFDLSVGEQGIRPDHNMGYAACTAASDGPVEQGSVGAGTGARCGGLLGNKFATKGGVGSASFDLGNGLVVAAMMAVNAVGDVVDEQGEILAGLRRPPDGDTFMGTLDEMKKMAHATGTPSGREHTVIGVVATNARLTKAQANRVAQMAHDGIARAIKPSHTMHDGDTIFSLATGEIIADTNIIGVYAALVVEQSIRKGIRAAASLAGIRAYND